MKKSKLLLSSLILTTLLIGCDQNGASEKIEGFNRITFDGIHEFDYEKTEDFLVKDNRSDYQIVMPNDPDSYVVTAREELTNLFLQATGVPLNTISEDIVGLEHDSENKYISLGKTKLFDSAFPEFDDSSLKAQSARIMTKDKSIYLYGGDSSGVLFAVYDLLEILFDFDAFSYDCINLSKKDNVNFYTMDIYDVPDIANRTNSWASIKENPNNIANRLRTPLDFSDYCISVGDTSVSGVVPGAIHNSLSIIPRNSPLGITYKEEWFSDAGDQICYTCHGDETAYQALVDQSALIIEKGLMANTPKNYPLKNFVTFTMMDNNNICNCPACTEATVKYGTASGQVIHFCNDLMAKIHDWMYKAENIEYRRENLVLCFFAYNGFINAPAHFDATQNKYVPNHEDVVMRDDVGVYYAVSSGFNYQKSFYDDASAVGRETYQKWVDISPSTLLWTYNANFGSYLSHVNSTNFYNNDAYRAFAAGNVKLIYNQGAWNSYNLTAFQMLAIYLDAKLSWNSNADMNKLIDKWFDGMYKEAANDMKQLFYAENMYSMILYELTGTLAKTGIINDSKVAAKDKYPIQLLQNWLSIIESARTKVAVYEEIDFDTYKMIKEHIDLEWVSPAYFLLFLYGKNFLSNEQYNQILNYFVDNILPLKEFKISERSGSLSEAIAALAGSR